MGCTSPSVTLPSLQGLSVRFVPSSGSLANPTQGAQQPSSHVQHLSLGNSTMESLKTSLQTEACAECCDLVCWRHLTAAGASLVEGSPLRVRLALLLRLATYLDLWTSTWSSPFSLMGFLWVFLMHSATGTTSQTVMSCKAPSSLALITYSCFRASRVKFPCVPSSSPPCSRPPCTS